MTAPPTNAMAIDKTTASPMGSDWLSFHEM